MYREQYGEYAHTPLYKKPHSGLFYMEALICARVSFFERLQKASRISHSTVGKERIR